MSRDPFSWCDLSVPVYLLHGGDRPHTYCGDQSRWCAQRAGTHVASRSDLEGVSNSSVGEGLFFSGVFRKFLLGFYQVPWGGWAPLHLLCLRNGPCSVLSVPLPSTSLSFFPHLLPGPVSLCSLLSLFYFTLFCLIETWPHILVQARLEPTT